MTGENKDKIQTIVDIDTFGYHLIDYTTKLKATAIGKPISEEVWEKRFLEAVSGLSSERFMEDAYPLIRIEQCPWDTVPESIKSIIAMQFFSSNQKEDQFVDVTIGRRDLVFALYNDFVRGRIETTSETYTGRGLLLLFGDEPEDSIVKKGEWRIARFPISKIFRAKYKVSEINPDLDDLIENTAPMKPLLDIKEELESLIETVPVKLFELHDLAYFLEKSKDLAVLYIPE